MNIETLIDKVTTQTVVKLKKSKLMSDNKTSAFKKTEDVLKNYNKYKKAAEQDDNIKSKKLIKIIDDALKTIEDDYYYEIIELLYIQNRTREDVSEHFNCDVKTITRNKKRLINELKLIIFSEESIEEIFSL